jgi:hypothetical protein
MDMFGLAGFAHRAAPEREGGMPTIAKSEIVLSRSSDTKARPFLYTFVSLGIFYAALVAFEICIRTIYIRSYPQDFFLQLDGIYRVSLGQTAYVDFSTPLGLFLYEIPELFVHFGSNLALSISYAAGLILIFGFAVVAYLVLTRLSPAFGLVLGIWIGLGLAARMNFGSDPTFVTIAGNYNREGTAALALALLMYRLPRNTGPIMALTDGVLYAVLTVFMLYTKITFAVVALLFIPVVFWGRRDRLVVFVGFIIVFCLMVLAVEYGFGTRFQWIHAVQMAIASDAPLRSAVSGHLHTLAENLPELLVCGSASAWFLWKDGRLTWLTIVFSIMVAGASVALIEENGQRTYLFLPAILFFVAATPAARDVNILVAADARSYERQIGLLVATIAILTLESGPQFVNVVYAAYRSVTLPPMVAGDNVLDRIVSRPENYEVGSGTEIRTVLDRQIGALDAFATGRFFKPVASFDTLTMSEYRDYLTDGMRAAREGCDPGSRILTLDLGNPFPLLLGWPAGGTMVIIHPNRMLSQQAHPSSMEMFRNINCVLVPKLPVQLAARDFMLRVYGPYLSKRYGTAYETKLWKVLKLKSPG